MVNIRQIQDYMDTLAVKIQQYEVARRRLVQLWENETFLPEEQDEIARLNNQVDRLIREVGIMTLNHYVEAEN